MENTLRQTYMPAGYFGLTLVTFMSACFVGWTFGWDFIRGVSGFWQGEQGDFVQYISGMNLYLSSPWQFPLLAFDSLNYPEGTRATFVDCLPALAFLLKVILPKDVGFINPFGYWIGLCFVLQGVSAWWITRELGVKSWAFLIFLSLVFLTLPEFMLRIGHITLMSQWIVLFAFALYLRGHRTISLAIGAWTFFLVGTFYLNIYLFVMAAGIYIASALDIRKKTGLAE